MNEDDKIQTARGSTRDNLKTSPPADTAYHQAPSSDGDRPDAYDPLKPENLRLDQSELDQPAVKPELTALPVRRPGKFEFVQVHPDPAYRLGPVCFIALGRDDYYIVPPNFRKNLKAREYWIGQIFLATNRLEKPFLWIVKLQNPAGRTSDWYTSDLECAERAMRNWVQVIADQDAGIYTVAVAEDDLEAPEFPSQSMEDLIKLAFKRRTVDSLDHPVFKQLRGRI